MKSLKLLTLSLFTTSTLAATCIPSINLPLTWVYGTGCPAVNSFKTTLSGEDSILSIQFDRYEAVIDPNNTGADMAKNCTMILKLNYEEPEGCRYPDKQFWNVIRRGYAQLDRGVEILESMIVHTGDDKKPFVKNLKGSFDASWKDQRNATVTDLSINKGWAERDGLRGHFISIDTSVELREMEPRERNGGLHGLYSLDSLEVRLNEE